MQPNDVRAPVARALPVRTRVDRLVGGLILIAVATTACDGGGGGPIAPTPEATVQPELLRVEYGRLVDVYGYKATDNGPIQSLFEQDVIVGSNIQDQRPTGSSIGDQEITYDFFGTDADTLQAKLFIPRMVDSDEFRVAFDALDDEVRAVTPMRFGEGDVGNPYSVVPRNAAIRLRFSAPLDVEDDFFVDRDASGRVVGLRNPEAVQLLRIVDDPEQPGGVVQMPIRLVVRASSITIDPVLLGSESLQYQTSNNAAGMPPSPDQLGANIRIALALEGPLAIPRLRVQTSGGLTGRNNSMQRSIVRDFRSGNDSDSSAELSGGFVRDLLPLRLVGEIPMYLERVDDINSFTQEVTIFKNGIAHEIDRGDTFRFLAGVASASPLQVTEVVVDPDDDRDDPAVQHVRVRIRRIPDLEGIDPSNQPGYPQQVIAREAWLVQNAPRAICVAEFTAGDEQGRDDPNNFLRFTPAPLALDGYRPRPNEFVSPHAGAVVRFSKPVDMESVRWADTFFFAMRDLATDDSIAEFIANRPTSLGTGMEPASFDLAKYRTPYLIAARVFDEDGSQTRLRLQPSTGFYLDDSMRAPSPGIDHRYFLHLISDSDDGGVRDLAGNRLDLQGTTADRSNHVVIPFTVDTRSNASGPVFPNNLAINVVRRFASRDEDANPSYFLPDEVQPANADSIAAAYPLEDLFGAFLYLDNKLVARPTTRSRVIADNLNQLPFQQQNPLPSLQNALGACPQVVNNRPQVANNTAGNVVASGVQNPLNPAGCRMQTLWREIDLSLSRTYPFDFNLDIEQMYWAPYTGTNLSYDEFDRTSLWLGHSEYRPVPCVDDTGALPSLPNSGIEEVFDANFLWNPSSEGSGSAVESRAPRVAAYVDSNLVINPSQVVYEPNGVNRFLPLPTFQEPYFVYRDETVVEQGGRSDPSPLLGSDLDDDDYAPYIVSPWLHGLGRRWVDGNAATGVRFVDSFWNDARNHSLTSPTTVEDYTGGLLGCIALPLLADFWTYCDSAELPAGSGYVALGTNGWQTAVTVQSNERPYFRAVSGGRVGSNPICVSPGSAQWNAASGGFNPQGQPTRKRDNTFYWIMMDVLKRQSVITNGFLDLYNPHRVPEGFGDTRLGPFFLSNGEPSPPAGVLPMFAYEFDPPLSELPDGTSLVPQFRGASAVDAAPWYWSAWVEASTQLFPSEAVTPEGFSVAQRDQLRPTARNFPLDPLKACDAHVRKWDTRPVPGGAQSRKWWTHLYNRTVTTYVEDPNELMDEDFTARFEGPNDEFRPADVRYLNWRFVASNNTSAEPPVAPSIETFALSYRLVGQ